MTAPALALDAVAKRFGPVTALADASLLVHAGTVHALLGENGAGKTTLMRIAYGMEQPDVGGIRVGGSATRLRSPADAIAAGIGMVHQHFTLVPAMSAAENIALGGAGRFDPRAAVERVRALAATTGLALEPTARVHDLGVNAQQRVELLKALARDPQILILDEPTAVLAPAETDELLRTIRQLATGGRAVVLITHKLREAYAVADTITVLRRGHTVLTAPARQTDEARIIAAMLGSDRLDRRLSQHLVAAGGRPIVQADQIAVADERGVLRIRDATFSVHGGEIVGVAGVEGSGHRELLRAIARRLPVRSGHLSLPAVVGFVPDDRHREGLALDMSLVENFALRGCAERRGRMPWRDLMETTAAAIERFDVRADGVTASANSLSGGNQQKFILARELDGPPPALVVESPERGLDVRATVDVYDELRSARSHGVAVVAYSADIDETLSYADRMLVVYAGAVHDLPADRDLVGRAMLGAV